MGLRVPANCSSITFAGSGVRIPASRLVTGLTAAEETALCTPRAGRSVYLISTDNTGKVFIQFPAGIITNITINGNGIGVNGAGVSASVNGADATAFLGATDFEPFQLAAA